MSAFFFGIHGFVPGSGAAEEGSFAQGESPEMGHLVFYLRVMVLA
jgi:hypothetical protein